jgi:hypothetical protein
MKTKGIEVLKSGKLQTMPPRDQLLAFSPSRHTGAPRP